MTSQHILITGGTGFVGRALIARLIEQGHMVSFTTRRPKGAFIPGARGVFWDIEGPLREPQQPVNAIVHLAGENIAEGRWNEYRKKQIRDSRVLGTRMLVESLGTWVTVPSVFVSASAIGYYGHRGDDWLTEDAARGTGFLSDVCCDWEQASVSLPKNIRRVILRIGAVLGNGGGILERLLPIFRKGLGTPMGSGGQWMSWIHMNDLTEIIANAVSDSRYEGVINAVSPNPLSNRSFTGELAKAVHRPHIPIGPPAVALKLALGEMAELVLGSQRVKPAVLENLCYEFSFRECAEALKDLVRK